MPAEVIIASRFHGPPTSGNGGYVCGLLAEFIGEAAATVTLRRPPPLETPLAVQRTDDGHARLLDGDDIVAQGHGIDLALTVPDPPSIAEAEAASRAFPGFRTHVFPTCFVCGPQRRPPDGLRIFPGRVAGRTLVAAPWTPDETLVGEDGHVRPEFLWAALDCPGVFGTVDESGLRPTVLGQLAARIDCRVRPGTRCVVMGWGLGVDGRKRYAGTAIFTGSGELCGSARATWIELRP